MVLPLYMQSAQYDEGRFQNARGLSRTQDTDGRAVMTGAVVSDARLHVMLHVALRDFNLDVPAGDGRRIEVVANGLPILQGAQIAVDATIVSPVRRDGPTG